MRMCSHINLLHLMIPLIGTISLPLFHLLLILLNQILLLLHLSPYLLQLLLSSLHPFIPIYPLEFLLDPKAHMLTLKIIFVLHLITFMLLHIPFQITYHILIFLMLILVLLCPSKLTMSPKPSLKQTSMIVGRRLCRMSLMLWIKLVHGPLLIFPLIQNQLAADGFTKLNIMLMVL